MSSSDSLNAFAMMESVALNESRVIVEDIDYVLVEAQNKYNNHDDMQVDDDSYDYCDDVVSMLSVEHLSVCSDLPSIDPMSFGMDATEEEKKPERRPRVISFGNDEDELCTRTGKFEPAVEPLDEQMSGVEETSGSVEMPDAELPKEKISELDVELSPEEERIESIAEKAMEDLKSTVATSRLSNKKRRKKMKLMKRAAAAAAAAAALSEMTAYVPTAPTLPSSPKPRKKVKSSNRAKKVSSVAVACAAESMEAYKQELATKKKGSSFVSPL